MSDDLIRRSDAIKAVAKAIGHILYDAEAVSQHVMNSVPAVEPKQGEWIPCSKNGFALNELMRREGQKWYGYRCSNCNYIYKGNALTECNYCPNCGARMKGADDE